MHLGLEGRRALVTGSTAGIGLATARELAREGAAVTITGRTEARVREALGQLRAELPKAALDGVAADLGTASGCRLLTEKLPETDVLVNSLGIFESKPFEEIADGDWLRFFETNVLSGVRMARQYLPGMRARNWGRIIFVSSESALQIPTDMIHYAATKTAQLAVARGLAEALIGTRITVNCVLPGPTASEGVQAFLTQTAAARGVDVGAAERDFFKTTRPTSILQRFAEPEEVAAMIVYLSSTRASATTGSALRVDGGVVRSIV